MGWIWHRSHLFNLLHREREITSALCCGKWGGSCCWSWWGSCPQCAAPTSWRRPRLTRSPTCPCTRGWRRSTWWRPAPCWGSTVLSWALLASSKEPPHPLGFCSWLPISAQSEGFGHFSLNATVSSKVVAAISVLCAAKSLLQACWENSEQTWLEQCVVISYFLF